MFVDPVLSVLVFKSHNRNVKNLFQSLVKKGNLRCFDMAPSQGGGAGEGIVEEAVSQGFLCLGKCPTLSLLSSELTPGCKAHETHVC